MNQNRIEEKWNELYGDVDEPGDDLNDSQMVSRIREKYGLSSEGLDYELGDWQQRFIEGSRTT